MSDQALSTATEIQRVPRRSGATRAELRVVQEAKQRSRSRQLACAAVLVVMFGALLASAVFHSVLVSGQQRLDRLDQRVGERQNSLSRSQLRVAELSSPSRIVAAAKRSGMVVPGHTTWLAATPQTTPSTPRATPAGPRPSVGSTPSTAPGSELASGKAAGTHHPATPKAKPPAKPRTTAGQGP